MIVSLRGTNGSGKSYLVTRLMKAYHAKPGKLSEKGKPLYYTFKLTNGKTVGIVGSYENVCGGCDGIQPYDSIWPRVLEVRKVADHVIFEGMAISSSYGSIGRNSEALGDEVVFAFLNTPIEECIRHIRLRRKAKGNKKPFDPTATIKKFRAVQGSIDNTRAAGRQIQILDYKQCLPQLIKLLLNGFDPKAVQPKFPTEKPPVPKKAKV